jgi:hypothetical protein
MTPDVPAPLAMQSDGTGVSMTADKVLALLVLASLLTACGVPGAVPSRQSVSTPAGPRVSL